jgi:hypothetical protein
MFFLVIMGRSFARQTSGNRARENPAKDAGGMLDTSIDIASTKPPE